MKSCKKFGLAAIALVLGALLCMSLTGCPTANTASTETAESKPYVGIYTAESGENSRPRLRLWSISYGSA